MTDTNGLLRDAGGARPGDELDALIERLKLSTQMLCREAAAALVQLRDSEALARDKIAEQMIKFEWLERIAVTGWRKCRAAEAALDTQNRAAEAALDTQNRALAQCRALLKQEIDDVVPLRDKVAALEAERDDYKAKWYQSNSELHAAWAERDALKAERADLIKINNGWAHEWDAMREQVEEMRKVIEAAKAMRHYFPHIPTQEFIHGDITAAFDAAIAALDKEQK